MSSNANFVRSLLRVIKLLGRDCIEKVFLGEFKIVEGQGGGKLVNTTVGGKSFSFQLPGDLSTKEVMEACDAALLEWDSLDSTQRDLLFTTRKQRTVRVVF